MGAIGDRGQDRVRLIHAAKLHQQDPPLASQDGIEDAQECRLIRKGMSDALDLRVWASRLTVGQENFTMFTVTDISDEKRRVALERIFLHDIVNTASAILGCSELLEDGSAKDYQHFIKRIQLLSARLLEEVSAQRQLIAAESGVLSLNLSPVKSLDLLDEIVIQQTSNTRGRLIRISPDSKDVSFTSDRVLVRRVIGNLLKNALEASSKEEVVTLGSDQTEHGVQFWVHNPQEMERDVQLQVFQRSFSTKGPGRGLGTYSVRLLTQRYLKGTVAFSSSREAGTTFRVTYPYAL